MLIKIVGNAVLYSVLSEHPLVPSEFWGKRTLPQFLASPDGCFSQANLGHRNSVTLSGFLASSTLSLI